VHLGCTIDGYEVGGRATKQADQLIEEKIVLTLRRYFDEFHTRGSCVK
jgi:hypothetical protein